MEYEQLVHEYNTRATTLNVACVLALRGEVIWSALNEAWLIFKVTWLALEVEWLVLPRNGVYLNHYVLACVLSVISVPQTCSHVKVHCKSSLPAAAPTDCQMSRLQESIQGTSIAIEHFKRSDYPSDKKVILLMLVKYWWAPKLALADRVQFVCI